MFSILSKSSNTNKEKNYIIYSPNNIISVHFQISGNKNAYYLVKINDKIILRESKLGIIREDEDFSKNLSIESVSGIENIKADYEMMQGKKHHCFYHGKRQVFHLRNINGKKIDIIFQVSNDGVAFRYYFPEQSNEIKKIVKETSIFNFNPGTRAYIQNMSEAKSGWGMTNPSYEEYYRQGVKIDSLKFSNAGWVFPALFNYDKYWMLLSETAPDRDYCSCRLQQDLTCHEFYIDFPQAAEIIFGGALNPESKLPWKTPWRIITIGNGLKTIVESTLGTDLAEPSKLKNTSYIKPGISSWSWALLKDDFTIYNVQKKFVDFASEMNWNYCLIDATWDTQIGYDKIADLAEYAGKKNVGLILWYNSAGDWNTAYQTPKNRMITHEDRVKEFKRIKKMGIIGIKVDFFGGDGQSVMDYYQDILEDAAVFELMVNFHGATLPRGLHRTYPNLITMEAVRGFEYVTFEQVNADNEPNHSSMLPFTRNVFDPMDFTPVCFSEVPGIKRITSNAFELALSVVFWSGIQHFVEIPEGMSAVPDYVKNFLKEIPAYWDDTQFIDGFPGKFVIIARKFKGTWYIAGINGENVEKNIDVLLPFIKSSKTGILITDGKNNRSFITKEITYNPDKFFKINLKGNGGFVLKIDD